MEFGIGFLQTHDAMGPGALARLLEERGCESLFFADHTHIPASRETPYPYGDLPRSYSHNFDLFVAMTAAAASTSRLRIGSGVCLVAQRDPIITAKEVASIDHISGGRVEFGVGAGWNLEEARNHGTDTRTRVSLMVERVQAIKAIWTEDEASYEGEFVNFERIWSWPKPAQHPHPPILIGGNGPTVLDRVLACADGWFPINEPGLAERAAELRGRADRPIGLHVIDAPADPRALDELQRMGANRAVHLIPSAGQSVVEQALERWERAIAEYTGETVA